MSVAAAPRHVQAPTAHDRAAANLGAAAPRFAQTPTAHDRAAANLVYRAIARVQRPGRFGMRKVFVAALWDEMCRLDASEGGSLTLDTELRHFQRWLFDARLLTEDGRDDSSPLVLLCRADYVSAMDPEQVAASEWTTNGATYHFVIDPSADPQSYAALHRSR